MTLRSILDLDCGVAASASFRICALRCPSAFRMYPGALLWDLKGWSERCMTLPSGEAEGAPCEGQAVLRRENAWAKYGAYAA